MKRISFATVILLLCAVLLSAADPSGKWKGSFDVNGTQLPFVMDIKSAAGKVTGTVTPGTNPAVEIKDGKLDGNALTFHFTTEYQGNPVHLIVKAQVGAEDIKISISTDDGS